MMKNARKRRAGQPGAKRSGQTGAKRTVQPDARTANPSSVSVNNNAIRRDTKVTWGIVHGYSISNQGITFKIDASAISNMAFFISSDAPCYRNAVSTIMLVQSQRRNGIDARLWVKYTGSMPKDKPNGSAAESQFILDAHAVGTGSDNPFEIVDWVMSPEWI